MKRTRDEYKKLYQELSPPSPSHKTIPAAFFVGGAICALGQLVRSLLENAGLPEKTVASGVSCALVFLGVALTAARQFEKLAKFAGAGTLVPITGFANSIASPAMEFKTEGFVLGTCVKMFSIAGPVLTFGISASVLYGLIYWLVTK